ncbi:hypothetical protein GGS21DRAFT_492175 [Xylaria nigripes]|nr:hypothetical protein GGS21DRAFT_492175 [Xylaria nigripes]
MDSSPVNRINMDESRTALPAAPKTRLSQREYLARRFQEIDQQQRESSPATYQYRRCDLYAESHDTIHVTCYAPLQNSLCNSPFVPGQQAQDSSPLHNSQADTSVSTLQSNESSGLTIPDSSPDASRNMRVKRVLDDSDDEYEEKQRSKRARVSPPASSHSVNGRRLIKTPSSPRSADSGRENSPAAPSNTPVHRLGYAAGRRRLNPFYPRPNTMSYEYRLERVDRYPSLYYYSSDSESEESDVQDEPKIKYEPEATEEPESSEASEEEQTTHKRTRSYSDESEGSESEDEQPSQKRARLSSTVSVKSESNEEDQNQMGVRSSPVVIILESEEPEEQGPMRPERSPSVSVKSESESSESDSDSDTNNDSDDDSNGDSQTGARDSPDVLIKVEPEDSNEEQGPIAMGRSPSVSIKLESSESDEDGQNQMRFIHSPAEMSRTAAQDDNGQSRQTPSNIDWENAATPVNNVRRTDGPEFYPPSTPFYIDVQRGYSFPSPQYRGFSPSSPGPLSADEVPLIQISTANGWHRYVAERQNILFYDVEGHAQHAPSPSPHREFSPSSSGPLSEDEVQSTPSSETNEQVGYVAESQNEANHESNVQQEYIIFTSDFRAGRISSSPSSSERTIEERGDDEISPNAVITSIEDEEYGQESQIIESDGQGPFSSPDLRPVRRRLLWRRPTPYYRTQGQTSYGISSPNYYPDSSPDSIPESDTTCYPASSQDSVGPNPNFYPDSPRDSVATATTYYPASSRDSVPSSSEYYTESSEGSVAPSPEFYPGSPRGSIPLSPDYFPNTPRESVPLSPEYLPNTPRYSVLWSPEPRPDESQDNVSSTPSLRQGGNGSSSTHHEMEEQADDAPSSPYIKIEPLDEGLRGPYQQALGQEVQDAPKSPRREGEEGDDAASDINIKLEPKKESPESEMENQLRGFKEDNSDSEDGIRLRDIPQYQPPPRSYTNELAEYIRLNPDGRIPLRDFYLPFPLPPIRPSERDHQGAFEAPNPFYRPGALDRYDVSLRHHMIGRRENVPQSPPRLPGFDEFVREIQNHRTGGQEGEIAQTSYHGRIPSPSDRFLAPRHQPGRRNLG